MNLKTALIALLCLSCLVAFQNCAQQSFGTLIADASSKTGNNNGGFDGKLYYELGCADASVAKAAIWVDSHRTRALQRREACTNLAAEVEIPIAELTFFSPPIDAFTWRGRVFRAIILPGDPGIVGGSGPSASPTPNPFVPSTDPESQPSSTPDPAFDGPPSGAPNGDPNGAPSPRPIQATPTSNVANYYCLAEGGGPSVHLTALVHSENPELFQADFISNAGILISSTQLERSVDGFFPGTLSVETSFRIVRMMGDFYAAHGSQSGVWVIAPSAAVPFAAGTHAMKCLKAPAK